MFLAAFGALVTSLVASARAILRLYDSRNGERGAETEADHKCL